MEYYTDACREAEKQSKEHSGTEWTVVFHKTLGFLTYRKYDKERFPEEWSIYRNGIEVYRKKMK
jgi:hypothetical protein